MIRSSRSCDGFTLIELMIVIAILATLMTMGVPLYMQAVKASKNAAAISDLKHISQAIEFHVLSFGYPPDSLAEIRMDHLRDPWGRPYQYLRLDGLIEKKNGKMKVKKGADGSKARKDHNLHPINTDYDLGSMGPDGKTNAPLTAKSSRDDIIRAQNGSFYGPAEEY